MANKQINELTEITSAESTDYLLVYDNDEPGSEKTKKIEVGNLSSGGWTYTDAVVTTSGTAIIIADDLPNGLMEIDILFHDVSTSNGAQCPIVRLGDSGGIEDTGYDSAILMLTNNQGKEDGLYTMLTTSYVAGNEIIGILTLLRFDSSEHRWIAKGSFSDSVGPERPAFLSGSKGLSGELTTIQITTPGGNATFDNGKIRVRYR
jgi:hypothetical protein